MRLCEGGRYEDAGMIDLSIVICTRNRAATLQGTLDALARIRSLRCWEAVIADNGSTDDTASVIAQSDQCGGRLRFLRVDRIGLGAGRDAAWRQSRGRIIAFTDDDCYLAPDYVDTLLKVFEDYPSVGCVGGRILLFDSEDARVTIDERTQAVETPPRRFVDAGLLHGANLAFRRSTLETIGGMDPDLGAGTPFPCEDIDGVAATLWSGQSALFHPAPVVWHHHRRRKADVDALHASYDRGRGAYYAKYLLRPDTRSATLRGWWNIARHYNNRKGLVRLAREMRSGAAYLRHKKAFGFVVAAAPIAVVKYGAVFGMVAWRILRRQTTGRPTP